MSKLRIEFRARLPQDIYEALRWLDEYTRAKEGLKKFAIGHLSETAEVGLATALAELDALMGDYADQVHEVVKVAVEQAEKRQKKAMAPRRSRR